MRGVLLLIYFSSCLVTACKAQDNKIEYIFPPKVNEEINKIIGLYEDKAEWRFYLMVNRVFSGDNCGNYVVNVEPYKDGPSETVLNLLNKNTHYYQAGKFKVPIIFDYDFAFIGYGNDSKGRVVRKSVIAHGGYSVEFTVRGEIVDKKK